MALWRGIERQCLQPFYFFKQFDDIEFSVPLVRDDNPCDFLKWFYKLPFDIRKSDLGTNIQQYHADFHTEAAKISQLALKGKKEDALQLLEAGSKYASISGKLYLALKQWKQTIR